MEVIYKLTVMDFPTAVTAETPDSFGHNRYMPLIIASRVVELPIQVSAENPKNFGRGDALPEDAFVEEYVL